MTTPESPFSAIKERLERATPGPWFVQEPESCGNCNYRHIAEKRLDVESGEYGSILARWHPLVVGCVSRDGEPCVHKDDAAFIAAAPSDIRTLLEAVEEKDAEIARLRASLHLVECPNFSCDECIAAARIILPKAALKGSDSSEGGRG